MKKPLPWHPVLLAAYPILFLYFHNLQHLYFGAYELVMPLFISCGFAILATLLLLPVLKDIQRSAVVTSAFLALFFSYGHLHAWLEGWTVAGILIGRHLVLLSLQIVVVAFVAGICLRAKNFASGITVLLNVFGLLLIFLRLSTGLYAVWTAPDHRRVRPDHSSQDAASPRKPHIFYIIADGYARHDVLKDRFGLDNSSFIAKLEDRGFYVAKQSNSNYNQTILSLSSSLNSTYLDSIAKEVGVDSTSKLPLARMLRYNKAADFLRSRGYKIVAFATGYSDTEMRAADTYLQPPGFSLTEFQMVLLNSTPLPAIFEIISPVTGRLEYDQHRARALFTLNSLGNLARSTTPLFVFAHVLIPHQPYVFGPNGEPINPKAPFSLAWTQRLMTRDQFIKGYHDQALFATKQLQKAVDSILVNSPKPPIVIIQGDHGYEAKVDDTSYTDQDYRDRMAILNAYYLPGNARNSLYPSITPVNTFRLLFNDYFNTKLPLLPDESYFSTERQPYKFVPLNRLLHSKPE